MNFNLEGGSKNLEFSSHDFGCKKAFFLCDMLYLFSLSSYNYTYTYIQSSIILFYINTNTYLYIYFFSSFK